MKKKKVCHYKVEKSNFIAFLELHPNLLEPYNLSLPHSAPSALAQVKINLRKLYLLAYHTGYKRGYLNGKYGPPPAGY